MKSLGRMRRILDKIGMQEIGKRILHEGAHCELTLKTAFHDAKCLETHLTSCVSPQVYDLKFHASYADLSFSSHLHDHLFCNIVTRLGRLGLHIPFIGPNIPMIIDEDPRRYELSHHTVHPRLR